MFKNESDFKRLISRLNINNKPNNTHRENLRRQMLSTFNETTKRHEPQPGVFRIIGKSIMKRPISKLAAAAVIIIAIGFLVVHQNPSTRTDKPSVSETTKSSAEMMTVASLNIAYRKGGMEAVEKICDKAFKMVGPRSTTASIQELFEEFNGQNLERTRL